MKKIVKVLILLLLVVVLVGLGVRLIQRKKAQEAKIPPATQYTLRVHTFTPKVGQVRLSLPYIALAANDRDAVLASRLAARVLKVPQSGAQVHKGQLLIELDKRDLEAKLRALAAQQDSAKAELEAAKTALASLLAIHARTEKLLKVQGASKEQFDREVSQIASAKAKIAALRGKLAELASGVAQLRQNLSYAEITAPVSGTVSAVMAHAGEMAMPGKPLLKISAAEGAHLQLSLPDDLNATALIYRGARLPLTSLHSTRAGLRLWRTPPLKSPLASGERVQVKLLVFEGEGVLLPPDTLLDLSGRKNVLLLQKKRAVVRRVHPLASGTQGVVVSDRDLAGRMLVEAKPDILLKLTGGVPVEAVKQ